MREILFRGKSIIDDKWVYGYYYKAKLCVTDKNLCDYITTPYPTINRKKSDHIMIIPETIGQYTGLCDKNGVKIFEGDIVKYDNTIHKVVFETRNKTAYFGLVYSDIETLPFGHYQDLKQIEIIGNIFENPDLVEGEENEYS